jgi:hypothetical protein
MVPVGRLDQPPCALAVAVLSHARILHTVGHRRGQLEARRGRMGPGDTRSGVGAADPLALDDRPDPWTKVHEPADPALLSRTRQFSDYAARWAAEH